MMKTMLRSAALSLACLSGPVHALTCTVTADLSHSFGTYYPLSGNPNTTSSDITVDCTGALLVVSVAIDLSTGSSGSYAPRKMYKGTAALNYNLYTDAAHTTIWGDGSGGTSTVSYSLLLPLIGSNSRTDTVYGLIPADQITVVPGSYSDTITVTVNYLSL